MEFLSAVPAVLQDSSTLFPLYISSVNLISFTLFGMDKRRAKRQEHTPSVRRIPERTLFLSAILGGSVGALLGMRVWQHKTRHLSFRIGIPLILLVQLALTGWLMYLSLH